MLKNQEPVNKPEMNMGDLVLIQDLTSKSFQPRFKEDFRVVGIRGNLVEVKNNHGVLSTFHITDVRKMTMAENVKEMLPDFKKFGRKGKLCMNPDLFQDLGWTLDRNPPDLTEFKDSANNDSICTQEGVNNTVKGVAQSKNQSNNNAQIHSANTSSPISPQKLKLRRSQQLKAKISSTTKNIRKALKGNICK